jgi:hypothetical protein
MSGLTPKSTALKGPGGYTTTTPTLKGGAGALKPLTGSRATPVHHNAVSPFSGGRRGKSVELRGDATIIPSVPDQEW